MMFLHFFCTELHCWASRDLQLVEETFTFTLKGADVLIYSKEGAFDNGTFFFTFQSVVDKNTMEIIWPVKTEVLFIM